MKNNIYIFLLVLTSVTGCKKFVQVDPPITALSSGTVYLDNPTAAAAVTGIYSRMSENTSGLSSGPNSLTTELGLAADELKNYSPNNLQLSQFYGNNLVNTSGYFWQELFQQIYVTNAVLEGLNNSGTLSPAIRDQLTGEAKFMRAFLYFYAVNIYSDFPLAISTDYKVNSRLLRSPEAKVYEQIIADLTDAQLLLPVDYRDQSGKTTPEKIRPNKYAAMALLARVYLFTKDYVKAEAQASDVISNTGMYSLSSLNRVFLRNSSEAIWQLQPVTANQNTFDGYYFVLTSAPGTGRFSVSGSTDLIASFDSGDQRLVNWIGAKILSGTLYNFPYKYKAGQNQPLTEYLMVIRLAELYLIRAEARIQESHIADGLADLNVLRKRATDLNAPSSIQLSQLPTNLSKDDALKAVLHERQDELFVEWGHRWFDLKRTGNIDAVMAVASQKKGSSWSSYKQLLPIPKSEIQKDLNLTQNTGYNN